MMNIDPYSPVGLWITEHHMIDPLQARIEMIMNKGLQIVVPDFIMPKFNPEPFTEDELREIYGHKRKPNTLRLRLIIRKCKSK
jgi:hypothetical protein